MSKYLDVVLKAPITSAYLSSERDIIKSSHNKTGINWQLGEHSLCHRNPNYLSIQLGAKSNKKYCPTEGLAHHIHFDTTMHDIL